MASKTTTTAKKTATRAAKPLVHKAVVAKTAVVKAVTKPRSKSPDGKNQADPAAKTTTLNR